MPAGDHWALDKRVPLALVVTIGLQTGGMVWWAASLTAASAEHERRIATVERTIEIVSDVKSMMRDVASVQLRVADISGQLGSIHSRLAGADAERGAMRAQIDRLERQFDRLARRNGESSSTGIGPVRPPVIDGDADAAPFAAPGATEGVRR